jgi:hypothetical protein
MTAGERRAPPRALDPILGLVERLDRARRRIQPMRPDGLLGVERRRHHGPVIELADGTRIEPGDRLADIHLDNRRATAAWAAGWHVAFGLGVADLRAYAARLGARPEEERPVALRSGGLLLAAAIRLGFEIGPPRRGRFGPVVDALEDWYLTGVLVRWNPRGRGRLTRGHQRLRAREAWLSTRGLLARYGPRTTSSTNGPSRGPPRTSRSGPSGPGASADSFSPAAASCPAIAAPSAPLTST